MDQNIHIMTHPLIQHKLALIRNKDASGKEFRETVSEIATLLCYDAARDLRTREVEVETPITTAHCHVLADKIAIVPILRAGLGMVEGVENLIPTARVGHIGLYRDPQTLEPVEYYCKLPEHIDQHQVFVLDPMLATGGSAKAAIGFLKKHGAKHIKFLCIIAAPEGLNALHEAHPDVEIICAGLDEKLNDHGYIVPGLGDAGDRIFGTK